MWKWMERLAETILDLSSGQWYEKDSVALVGYKCTECSYGWRTDGIIEVVARD